MSKRQRDVDVLVVGGGPGGTPAALALAAAGQRVLLVEKSPGLGGTCLFEGCIPSKILWESARRLRQLHQAKDFGLGVPAGAIELDWATLLKRKHDILQKRAQGAFHQTQKFPTLEALPQTHARLLDAHSAWVQPPEGTAFDVRFKTAILATGSAPNLPPITGIDLPGVITSKGMLQLDHRPRSLAVIGAGPIGVEMAQIFHTFGTDVSMLEMAPRILLPVDEALALRLQKQLEADGIKLELNARVVAIRQATDGLLVNYTDALGNAKTLCAEFVLTVTGRHPNSEGLGLENTAVVHDRHGIKVNAHLQTTEPHIYATGDVAGQLMFAHWAVAQSLAVAQHLLGKRAQFPTPELNTDVIFSTPELGMAGLTEAQAKEAGYPVAVANYDYAVDARAQIDGLSQGYLKIVYRTDTRQVVGIHLLSEGAGDLLGEAALAVRTGTTLESLATSIHPHPTLNEAFGILARTTTAKLTK